jgi:hypothetical protein
MIELVEVVAGKHNFEQESADSSTMSIKTEKQKGK